MKKNFLALNLMAWLSLVAGASDGAFYLYRRVAQSQPPDASVVNGITCFILLGLGIQLAAACLKDIDQRLSKLERDH